MGKTVIVTGATRGIGLAITTYLLKQGHNVVATARSGHLLKDLLKDYPNRLAVISGNIANPHIAYNIAEAATENFGRIDGLVINHGTLDPVMKISDSRADDWKKSFDVNFFSAISLLEATLPDLRRSKGRIVFTSSGAARHSYVGWGAYCASKAALKSLGDTLALEEADIITMSVEPGTVDTDMQKDIREKHISVMDEKDHKRFMTLHKDEKLARPEGPGHLIANLVLKATEDLNGQTFRWDSDTATPYRDDPEEDDDSDEEDEEEEEEDDEDEEDDKNAEEGEEDEQEKRAKEDIEEKK